MPATCAVFLVTGASVLVTRQPHSTLPTSRPVGGSGVPGVGTGSGYVVSVCLAAGNSCCFLASADDLRPFADDCSGLHCPKFDAYQYCSTV